VSCAKTAKPIETQFGMLSRVGPGNMYYMGMYMLHGTGHFWGCLADGKSLQSIEFWGSVKGWVVQKTDGPILTLKFLVALIFLKSRLIP